MDMPRRARSYIILLGKSDRVVVRLVTDAGLVLEFSVQQEVVIEGRWHKIIRYDNAHRQAHRHVYYPHAVQYIQNLQPLDNNQALTQAIEATKKHFLRRRESYILLMNRSKP